ncbi:hypothetical protein GH714_031890 [Hevea brasiliensis]|uniref:Leucine-rich repeat-containing N-terminal plant-type domain-containing protein n=1 Tax=Hevea brasiliensis TaxID=3981 RepID=A0A6A6LDB6_HEVBR|nr:hypothetical protein GH714_031890 [Hevea brasiliensis]
MGSATATVVEILAILILLQSVLFCCNRANVNGSCIKIERDALIKIKASHGINSSYSLLSWVGDNCCRWEGVTCDNITGHVVELSFYWDDLQGKVSLHLGNLSNLQDLYLNQDRKLTIDSLHFPPSLKYLKMEGVLLDKCDNCLQSINMLPSLLELSMSNCELSLTGHVSHVNLTSLEVLDLSYNNFNSTIPSWLFNISNLQHLDLSYNAFQGSLSTEIGNLNSLAFLDLSYNSLEGENLSSLKILSLHSNKFEGEIPLQLCFLASLHILNLANNMMIGTIPTCFGNFTAIVMHEDKGLWDYHTSENPYVQYDKDSYGENVQVYVKGIELEYTKDVDELPKGHEKVGNMRKDDSKMLWFYSGLGIGFVTGFVGVCSILYFKDSWRQT